MEFSSDLRHNLLNYQRLPPDIDAKRLDLATFLPSRSMKRRRGKRSAMLNLWNYLASGGQIRKRWRLWVHR
jgi:hypothetical protein